MLSRLCRRPCRRKDYSGHGRWRRLIQRLFSARCSYLLSVRRNPVPLLSLHPRLSHRRPLVFHLSHPLSSKRSLTFKLSLSSRHLAARRQPHSPEQRLCPHPHHSHHSTISFPSRPWEWGLKDPGCSGQVPSPSAPSQFSPHLVRTVTPTQTRIPDSLARMATNSMHHQSARGRCHQLRDRRCASAWSRESEMWGGDATTCRAASGRLTKSCSLPSRRQRVGESAFRCGRTCRLGQWRAGGCAHISSTLRVW